MLTVDSYQAKHMLHMYYVCVFILDLLKTNVEILKKYR